MLLLCGCLGAKPTWETASFIRPIAVEAFELEQCPESLAEAEQHYADAAQLERNGDHACVDAYLKCAQTLWPIISSQPLDADFDKPRAAKLYRSAVGKLIETSQQFGRFDPELGITQSDASPNKPRTLTKIRYHGFSWQPSEFQRFVTVGDYTPPEVIQPKRESGLGVPLLGQLTCSRDFVIPEASFAATAIVRRVEEAELPTAAERPFVLDFINPLSLRDTQVENRRYKLAYDLTAPLAYLSANTDDSSLTGFLRPYQEETNAGLHMLEPYQPGKIPVVFIHGLASSPMTWAAMGNELFQHIDLLSKYQFWIFKYPTGKPFVGEAANLRRQFVELREQVDPDRRDRALDHILLIGHSMGGLVSKLQITSSRDDLAQSVFKGSLDDLELTPELRELAKNSLYFEPSNQIRRVIFVGTPHRGSKIASSPVGSLASKLVRQKGTMAENFSEFVKHNQNNISTMWRELPTSVDLLKPGNPTLEAIYALPVSPSITMHSIIGTGHHGAFAKEPSDGVVPVSSARHRDVESELLVEAHHDLHHHPDTIAEVTRILRDHADRLEIEAGSGEHDTGVEVNFISRPAIEQPQWR